MALLSLLFNKPRKVSINAPNSDGKERELIIIDATTSITHANEAEPTEFPIEDGSIISDHVEVKPKSITLSGVISEAPLSLINSAIGSVAGAVGGLIGDRAGSTAGLAATTGLAVLGGALLDSAGTNRVKDAYNSLLEVQDKKIPVTLITGLRIYNSMILTSFTPTETVDTGDSLLFSATFKEIRIVSSLEVTLSEAAVNGPGHSATQKQNLGKPGVDSTTSDTAANETILNRLIF